MSDEHNLPSLPGGFDRQLVEALPLALQIFFDDRLYERCKAVAHYIAKAEGVTPRHLVGKPEACFTVVSRALTWRLDPYAVAQATYMTPGGQIGYQGNLCQAALENSGRLTGGIKFDHYGDWSKLQGKFRMETGRQGVKYAVPNWKAEDEIGLGVVVSGHWKTEAEPRTMRFDLVQAHPRNSTLWATDPMTQIQYTAVRRFATTVGSSIFMGIPFDRETETELVSAPRDITPPRDLSPASGNAALREALRASVAAVEEEAQEPRREPSGEPPPPPPPHEEPEPQEEPPSPPHIAEPEHDEETGELPKEDPFNFPDSDELGGDNWTPRVPYPSRRRR